MKGKKYKNVLSVSTKEKQKQDFDSKNKIKTFERGDKVLKQIPVRNSKLDPKYEGPFVVTEKIGDTTYLLKNGANQQIQAHGSQLKTYEETRIIETSYETRRRQKEPSFMHLIPDEDPPGHTTISSRRRKPRNNLIAYFYILMISLAHCHEYGTPLVWRKLNHKIMTGRTKVNANIMLVNPCTKIQQVE